ncbi:MAG: polysaccharide biosynthesis C-terminal domain-containing protein [Bacteroidetes bacterium]|nr:polysaccharide biosynthesis C-terminal domain-containing protein [Bacteroidota bacterium]
MQRKFVTNIIFLLALNFLIKPFWLLGIDRSIQNIVGSESYGFYFAVFNFSLLFNIILDFGITSFNNRNIAQNKQLLKKHFSGIIVLKVLLISLYGIVVLLAGIFIGYDSKQLYFLLWVGINQALLSFILYLRSNISGLLLFKTDSIISVLDRFLMILICSLLIWGNILNSPFQIEWLIYSQTIAYLITLVVALIIVIRKSGFQKPNWNGLFLIMVIKKSLPFALMLFLMGIYNRVDSVMLERILSGTKGEFQSGVFAQAYRLFDAGNNIALLFGVILLPIFARMIKKKESVEKLVKLSFTIIFTFAIILAMSSYFYRDEIMKLLYSQHGDEMLGDFNQRILQSGSIFGILMFSFVAVCSSYIFGTLLTALGDLRFMIKVALVGVLINLATNILLIPSLEAVGAAYASLGAQTITAFAMIIGVQKRFAFRINYRYLSQLFSFILLVWLLNFVSKISPMNSLINYSCVMLISLLFAYLLRLLNVSSFIAILKTDPRVK